MAEKRVKIVGTFPADSHPPIRYPISVTKAGTADATRYVDFVRSKERCAAVFEKYGFAAASKLEQAGRALSGVTPGGGRPRPPRECRRNALESILQAARLPGTLRQIFSGPTGRFFSRNRYRCLDEHKRRCRHPGADDWNSASGGSACPRVRIRTTDPGAILDELTGRVASAPRFFERTAVCSI